MKSSVPCASELEMTSMGIQVDGTFIRRYSVPPRDAQVYDDFFRIETNANGGCGITLPSAGAGAWCNTLSDVRAAMEQDLAQNWSRCILDHQTGSLAWGLYTISYPQGWVRGDPFFPGTYQADYSGCSLTTAYPNCAGSQMTSGCKYYKMHEAICDACRDPQCTGCSQFPMNICRNSLIGEITERLAQGNECSVGNPCLPSSGSKISKEFDFSFGGFDFYRFYNSRNQAPNTSFLDSKWYLPWGTTLSQSWSPAFNVTILTPEHNIELYSSVASGLYRDVSGAGSLLRFEGGEWTLEYADGRILVYDSAGKIKRWRDANRPDAEVEFERDSRGRINQLVDQNGRKVELKYDNSDARLAQIVLPSDPSLPDTIDLMYNTAGFLQTVSRSDGSERTYAYADPLHPGHLTSITDENGVEFSEYRYDAAGRVIFSANIASNPGISPTQYAGSVSLSYTGDVTTVTDAYGEARAYTYEYAWQLLYPKLVSVADSVETTVRDFDATTGKLTQKTDGNGNVTNYAYADSFLRETLRDEAVGTPEARRVLTQWDSTSNRATERRVESVDGLTQHSRYTYTYNSRGQLLTSTQTDPVTSASRTTTSTYCEAVDVAAPASTCPVLGLLKSVDGPRTDVSDITTYAYYAATDESGCATTGPCHRKGDLWKITNALGHATFNLRYDRAGRVQASMDPNDVITEFTWHPRGWLTSRTVKGVTVAGDAVTTYSYDAVGQVTRITQPDGDFLDYEYDPAHRLVAIEDALGNRIEYTLDAAGNRTAETTSNAAAVVKRELSRIYDQLGRLEQQLDAQSRATAFEYDATGNQTAIEDARGIETRQEYDPLDRLKTTIQDYAGLDVETGYDYDALDRLVTVTDPKGLGTHYTYDGLGNLTQLDSPDTGVTTYTYDAAGNRLTQTDARGVTATHTYDALNRLTGSAYPDSSLDTTYYYDTPSVFRDCGNRNRTGRLASSIDATGTSSYCYDQRGNLTRKQLSASGKTFVTDYSYTPGDRLQQITLPTGLVLIYERNALGQITSIKRTDSVPNEPIVTAAAYLPFGPLQSLTFSGGATQTFEHDQNYWTDGVTGTALGLDFTLDATGNITAANDPAPASARIYSYDPLARLTDIETGSNTLIEAFTYDGTGNRLSKQAGGGTQTYGYPPDSHRLASIDAQIRSYDATGSLTTRGTDTFTYDDRQRLSAFGATASYTYNARGERASKSVAGVTTQYVYDEAGHLIAELDPSTTPPSAIRSYVWLGTRPVAVYAHTGSYANQWLHIHTDELGTPRAITRPAAANVIIWRWDFNGSAFGDHAPHTDPDGDTTHFAFNLRFPGQYFDAESGLHYNYFRDYEPATGRYVQSDPAGISDGPSTYGYSHQNPLVGYDPLGLTSYRGFDPRQEAEMRQAVEEAKRKIEECQTCDANGNCECFPSKKRKDRLIKKLNSATFIYKPDLGLCGYIGPVNMLRGQVQVGAPAFGVGCCSLASTLAHEVNHLLRSGESSSYDLEEKCFGCPGRPE